MSHVIIATMLAVAGFPLLPPRANIWFSWQLLLVWLVQRKAWSVGNYIGVAQHIKYIQMPRVCECIRF
jgi:cytochrome b subunit of formate dehydrogenase